MLQGNYSILATWAKTYCIDPPVQSIDSDAWVSVSVATAAISATNKIYRMQGSIGGQGGQATSWLAPAPTPDVALT